MTDKPRMTVQVSNGRRFDREVEILLNPAARKRMVDELMKLDRANDHVHSFSFKEGDGGLLLSKIPYHPDDQPALKTSLRYDDWDKQHFPHVMTDPGDT